MAKAASGKKKQGLRIVYHKAPKLKILKQNHEHIHYRFTSNVSNGALKISATTSAPLQSTISTQPKAPEVVTLEAEGSTDVPYLRALADVLPTEGSMPPPFDVPIDEAYVQHMMDSGGNLEYAKNLKAQGVRQRSCLCVFLC